MESGGGDQRYVNLVVRLRGGDSPGTEQLWAWPVEVTDAGGIYRLANNGFRSPLVIGDVVEVQLDGARRPQVVGVLERGGRPGWLIHFDDDDGADAERLVDQWSATGTLVERDGPTVSVALDPSRGPEARPTESELRALSGMGLVVGFLRLSDGIAFTDEEAAWMRFDLDDHSGQDRQASRAS